MFKRRGRNYKFLSISTKGDRLLFHVPIKHREEIFNQQRMGLKIFSPIDPRDKNQIDLKLEDINSLETIKKIILFAYEERE